MTDLTDDLVAFLRARLDEDEQTATAATEARDVEAAEGMWGTKYLVLRPTHPGADRKATAELNAELAAHIARHDPARVLREVEAKRLILAEYENENRVMERGHRTAWTDGGQAARHTVLKAFALPYADHPDYNPDWRL